LGVLADTQHGACCKRHLTNRSSCQAAGRVAGRGLLAAPPAAALCSPQAYHLMFAVRRDRRPAAERSVVTGGPRLSSIR
jgi:hypothetical protein